MSDMLLACRDSRRSLPLTQRQANKAYRHPEVSNSVQSVTKTTVRFNLEAMSTVAEIIEAVKRLDVEEKREFLSRLLEVDFDDAWDHQIEADARAGRLDSLWQQALTEIKAGNVKPLDDVLNNT